MDEYDFVIIGAGLSGVDAAYRLKTMLPECSYTVLEARDQIGGTWSFFNFPGIRSDSQLTLFGLPWRPWLEEKDMADAALIRQYIQDAARDEGIDKKIQFSHRVTEAHWLSEEQQWTLVVGTGTNGGGPTKQYRARWVISCSGYYDYENPLKTEIPGIGNFKGTIAHPQFWPSDLDWSGKRVVIIGSGATAVTLLPSIAKTAGHVTMLQRSPSYVLTLPSVSPEGVWIKKYLPAWLAHPLNWWRCFLTETLFVWFNLTFPNLARRLHLFLMNKQLPADVPVDVHFNPRYKPFEQRLCICPDGDFFKALHQDNCAIVTSTIRAVEEDGIMIESGEKLDADIIITATGLHVQLLGGVIPTVDGKPVDIASSLAWRGMMLSGVPNLATIIGYTIQSWTLGADASIQMLIRVYKHMRRIGATSAVPVHEGDLTLSRPVVSHSSTYFVTAEKRLPRITGRSPWYGRKNPVYDRFMLWFGSITDGMMYVKPGKKNQ
ncbi:hypothetical protein DL767_004727 [Monosporascus sp. MG133]|nr:hypothetical protein DL767_004727 [Monosporascus sp. MG133]